MNNDEEEEQNIPGQVQQQFALTILLIDYLITSDDIIQVEGENAGEEEEASDDVHMEEDDENDAEAGEQEEQEPDAEEM